MYTRGNASPPTRVRKPVRYYAAKKHPDSNVPKCRSTGVPENRATARIMVTRAKNTTPVSVIDIVYCACRPRRNTRTVSFVHVLKTLLSSASISSKCGKIVACHVAAARNRHKHQLLVPCDSSRALQSYRGALFWRQASLFLCTQKKKRNNQEIQKKRQHFFFFLHFAILSFFSFFSFTT